MRQISLTDYFCKGLRLRILPLAEIRIQTEKTRLQQRLRQMRRLRLNEESSKSKGRLKIIFRRPLSYCAALIDADVQTDDFAAVCFTVSAQVRRFVGGEGVG